jgi:biopolymer transport protein ExbD
MGFTRRGVVGTAVAVVMAPLLADCAAPSRAPRATWVRLRPKEGGYSIDVNGREVQLSELDDAVLARAMADNPGRTEDDVRQNVRIYVRSEGRVTYGNVIEVMRHVDFARIGLVAEDAR